MGAPHYILPNARIKVSSPSSVTHAQEIVILYLAAYSNLQIINVSTDETSKEKEIWESYCLLW